MRFRKFNLEDITIFTQWLHQDYIAKWYENPEDWIYEIVSEDFSWISHFIVEYDNRPIGFCQYYDYVKGEETWHGSIPREGTYSIDYLIGEPEFIGKGLGKEIIKTLNHIIFSDSDAKRIIVQPEEENHASCNTLLAAGFDYDEENKLYMITRNKVGGAS